MDNEKALDEIRVTLDKLFPTGGVSEVIDLDDPKFVALQAMILERGAWIPEGLQKRIESIESNMCRRQPLVLGLMAWLEPEDLDCETF